jgi:NAD(P)-dependent dehydrogenase (short-subunit alcohol dehydrogenase family)
MSAGGSTVAIVTGASSGIGEACARRLHEAGFVVHAVARRTDRMADLAAMGVHTRRVDVTVDSDLVALVDGVLAEHGRVDVLVNNAGYGSYGALEDVAMDEARRQLEVNLVALARTTQLVLPSMRGQRSGRIVNISSMGGRFGEPMGAWYHATKFAVEGLSDSLRMELAPFGIHVVVVQPGSISTEWGPIAAQQLLESSASGAYAEQAVRSAAVLARRSGGRPTGSSPDVVARAVVAAATARRPHTRYRVGAFAKPVTVARKLMPDRLWDRTLTASYDFEARRTSSPGEGTG